MRFMLLYVLLVDIVALRVQQEATVVSLLCTSSMGRTLRSKRVIENAIAATPPDPMRLRSCTINRQGASGAASIGVATIGTASSGAAGIDTAIEGGSKKSKVERKTKQQETIFLISRQSQQFFLASCGVVSRSTSF